MTLKLHFDTDFKIKIGLKFPCSKVTTRNPQLSDCFVFWGGNQYCLTPESIAIFFSIFSQQTKKKSIYGVYGKVTFNSW